MKIQHMKRIGITLCMAAVCIGSAVQAADWHVPAVGIVTLPDGTVTAKGMPLSVAAGKKLDARLHRYGIYGSEYWVLRGQKEANFAYAWAALIPMDAAFMRTQEKPVNGTFTTAKLPAGVPRTVKSAVRDVPGTAGERLERAAGLVREIWGANARDIHPFAVIGRNDTVARAHWVCPLEQQGVIMDQQYDAWLIDQGNTVDLFLLVTDTRHSVWTSSLIKAWEMRKHSRSRYFA